MIWILQDPPVESLDPGQLEEVWGSLLSHCHRDADPNERQKMDDWLDLLSLILFPQESLLFKNSGYCYFIYFILIY